MIPSIYKNLGSLIQEKRNDAGLSQKQLSAKIAINRVTLANMEGGKKRIFFDDLLTIMNALKISFSEIENAIKNVSVEDKISLSGIGEDDEKKLLDLI